MEYASGGDLFQLVVRNRGLQESEARWYFQQLIIAVDYCHKMVHLSGLSQYNSFLSCVLRLIGLPHISSALG